MRLSSVFSLGAQSTGSWSSWAGGEAAAGNGSCWAGRAKPSCRGERGAGSHPCSLGKAPGVVGLVKDALLQVQNCPSSSCTPGDPSGHRSSLCSCAHVKPIPSTWAAWQGEGALSALSELENLSLVPKNKISQGAASDQTKQAMLPGRRASCCFG